MAEYVLKHLVAEKELSKKFSIESCGTIDYHHGDRPGLNILDFLSVFIKSIFLDSRFFPFLQRITSYLTCFRTCNVLTKKYGMSLEIRKKARGIVENDFKQFDFILCMDADNLRNVLKMSHKTNIKKRKGQKIQLLTDFSTNYSSVPDPYYGGKDGFFEVFKICAESCANFLKSLKE